MKRPLIGIMPLYDSEKDSYWMLPGYMRGIEAAGGAPVMLPLTDDARLLRQLGETLDGLLFTGGQDISPRLYGEKAIFCGEICPARDRMELIMLDAAMELDRPVLGICRGLQFINAALGGTLFQDIPVEFPSAVKHCQTSPYYLPAHEVTLLPGTPLAELLGREKLQVNSYHHQGIKALAPGLLSMAIAPDGLIEAVYMPEKRFLRAVQWHPEFSFNTDGASFEILQDFVSSCKI